MSTQKFLVPRELLEELLEAMQPMYSLPAQYYGSTLGERIRDLLAQPSDGALTDEGVSPVEFDQRKDLACWFGLSYASFLVLPRVLMQDMPQEWQERMAVLLNEYDDAFPNQPEIGTRVQATHAGKTMKMPPWLLNYRHPARDEIERLRGRGA